MSPADRPWRGRAGPAEYRQAPQTVQLSSRVGPSPSVTSGPLEVGDPAAIAELGATLSAAGFSGEGVRAALGSQTQLLARSGEIPLYERRLAGVEPLGTIVKMLVLDVAVPVEAARRAFAPLPLERLEALGIVETGGGEARALVRVVPHDELLIASDRRYESRADNRPDHVGGVHGPSLTLSHLTVRRPVETALDVGAGGGIEAILAARHSDHVVATDVNARALNFAGFNTRLNGVDNVELRLGSFFEPVEGERFGLLQEGLRFRAGLDQATGALLAALDGKRTLGEVADELARLQGASHESVRQSVLPVATQMLAAGFLERVV